MGNHKRIALTAFAVCFLVSIAALAAGKPAAAAPAVEFGEIKPVIAYEFQDTEDFGKDSFGNADLLNAVPNTGMRQGEDGGVRFTGDSVLYADTVRNGRDFSDLLDTFTVSIWTRPLASDTSRVFSSGMYGHKDGFLLLYEKADTGKSLFTFRIGYNDSENSRNWEIADPSAWQHFAFSVNAATRKFAVSLNGETVLQTDMEGELAIASAYQVFALGGFMHTGASGSYDYYNGEIDDVRIYGYAMEGGTMNALHAAGRKGRLALSPPAGAADTAVMPEESVQNPACDDFLLLNRLPQTVTVKSGQNEGTASVVWLVAERSGSTGLARGILTDMPFPNAKGIAAEARFRFDEKGQLPFTLAPVFADDMLLSRNRARVYGSGGTGTIRAELRTDSGTVASGETECKNGDWQIELCALPVHTGGVTLTVTSSSQPNETIVLRNIAIGEVWLASGQSNMDWEVNRTANPSLSSYQNADYSNIRYFKQRATPKEKVTYPYNLGLQWRAAQVYDSEVTGDYSAYATAFALELQKALSAREGKPVPVGVIQVAVGGSKIEQWLSKEAMADIGRQEDDSYTPSEFYNGMLAHVMPFSYDGMIWYQGESNCNDITRHPAQFKRLIADIREASGSALPVISAQLVQFRETDWPQFRQMQWNTMEQVERSYVNCGIDLGEAADIHPQKDKYLFGSRSAGIAMKYVYGDETAAGLSPYPNAIEYEPGTVRIRVADAVTLAPVYADRAPDGFRVMVNGKWQDAAASVEGNLITLTGFSGKATQVAYAQFANTAGFKNGFNFLYNERQLPLAPFVLGSVQKRAAVTIVDGGATVSGGVDKILCGGRITFAIRCPEGMTVVRITQNGSPVYYAGGNATFISAPVYEDTVIEIELGEIELPSTHSVTASVTGKGSINVPPDEIVANGASRRYAITPEPGYELIKVTVNGSEASLINGQLILNGIDTDLVIAVEFAEKKTASGCGSAKASAGAGAMLAVAAAVYACKRKLI